MEFESDLDVSCRPEQMEMTYRVMKEVVEEGMIGTQDLC
jgi:hypothetical protein